MCEAVNVDDVCERVPLMRALRERARELLFEPMPTTSNEVRQLYATALDAHGREDTELHLVSSEGRGDGKTVIEVIHEGKKYQMILYGEPVATLNPGSE